MPGVVRNWGEDDSGCPILHVDMDAFFASVELISRPELRGRPVIVGCSQRAVVLAATYEARAFGVHSAMPMTRARRLCPQAVVLPPDHRRYREVSAGVMAVLGETTDLIEQVSIDEAFLDVSGAARRLGSPAAIGRWIRAEVFRRFAVRCSVGVADTMFVAKIASGAAKPDGLLVVPHARTVEFLHALPVSALWGVGERTREALARWGITTVAELAATDQAVVQRAVGGASGAHLHALAWGRDPRRVTPSHTEKSIGAETTFVEDTADLTVLEGHLLRLADRTAGQLRARGFTARTVAVKVRTSDFRTISRSRTLATATDSALEIHAAARDLLRDVDLGGLEVRLVGVRTESLARAAPRQPTLEDAVTGRDEARRRADAVVDEVRAQFGAAAIRPAGTIRGPAADPPGPPTTTTPLGGLS